MSDVDMKYVYILRGYAYIMTYIEDMPLIGAANELILIPTKNLYGSR